VGGEDIPLLARIVQIADSFDAMVSRRAYNSPRSDADALAELRREAGTQFDPRLVEAFLDSYKGV
jgi:response regulator RpfG family c-di-GMP phosphodiesterase